MTDDQTMLRLLATIPPLTVLRGIQDGGPPLSPGARLVLLAVAAYSSAERPAWAADDGGIAWGTPRLEDLTRFSGFSATKVWRALVELRRVGVLVTERQRRKPSRYTILWPRPQARPEAA